MCRLCGTTHRRLGRFRRSGPPARRLARESPPASSHPAPCAAAQHSARSPLGSRAPREGPTERAGFEPAVRYDPYTGLANRRIQPLCHLSTVLPAGSTLPPSAPAVKSFRGDAWPRCVGIVAGMAGRTRPRPADSLAAGGEATYNSHEAMPEPIPGANWIRPDELRRRWRAQVPGGLVKPLENLYMPTITWQWLRR